MFTISLFVSRVIFTLADFVLGLMVQFTKGLHKNLPSLKYKSKMHEAYSGLVDDY